MSRTGPSPSDLREAAGRPASFLQTMRAVAWSFFGVRKRAGYEQDASQLNPLHVVVAGVLAAALFIVALVMTVRWVVGAS